MALTPEIRSTKGLVFAPFSGGGELLATKSTALTVYNIPTENIRATKALVFSVETESPEMTATKATVLAVIRGRIDNPKLVSWAYTLDGHDYYVLRLGSEGKTLVFDLATGQWSWFSTDGTQRWRPNIGMNWISSGNLPATYGSNVIVGDDSYGALYILDPEKGMDDQLLVDEERSFPRVATGQMVSKDRNFIPIFSVDLSASFGMPVLEDNTVSLEYSDDAGHTYVNADATFTAVEGDYNQEFTWRSLGRAGPPGRLFRITDDGAFARIDALTVNE